MATDDNPGRALVSRRRTVETVCAVCGVTITARIRDTETGEPERRYCSPNHRAKAYYLAHREERLAYQRARRAAQRQAGAGE